MKTTSFILSLACPVLLSGLTVQADENCLLDDGVVFSCSVDGGKKTLTVCDHLESDDPIASYVYAVPGGTAELFLQRPYSQVSAQPWNGMGPEEWSAITFTHGAYSYEVYASSERGAAGETSGGVTVSKAGAIVAEKTCDAGSVRETLGDFIEKLASNEATSKPD